MRLARTTFLAAIFLFAIAFCVRHTSADDIADRARALHFSSIVLDTHDDTTQRFFTKDFDLGKRNPDGHVDIPAHAGRRHERHFLLHLD